MTSTTLVVHGLTYERVTDLRTLARGDWLRHTRPLHGADTITTHLSVLEPFGEHESRDGVLCRVSGRGLHWTTLLLETAHVVAGQVWRATEQPSHGIPGSWCDGLDDNGDPCGRSLHRQGDCRHGTRGGTAMGKGKPRTSHAATQARKAVLDALQADKPVPEPEARAMVDLLVRETRQVGYSDGYDEGSCDATYDT
ncbi:hypothetical protein PV726_32460 [Streptomyces europaeiscabiei]|uniref:hypothetical protein n=1 Tax=Streptomyces europaeiscabiei TaxID=146819 RepID=UPI0029BE30C2|nr:hypothetical protein [Streptomyces europaeiscabiei]MDX3694971.1 hypothetical protein [Streptomyces europaeiscabiei]